MSVSLREIAEATGLSRMAVSLALRGKPGVSKAKRASVLKAAEKLGYEPDPALSKMLSYLRSSRQQERNATLGLLTSGAVERAWMATLTERNYVAGVEARAREYGYRVEHFWMNAPGMNMRRLGNIIWNRGIEGAIIAPLQDELHEDSPRRVELDYNLFSVVEISETVSWPNLDRALHDQYTSMQILLHELRKRNYQRMGLVLQDALDRRVNGKWTAAYLEDARHHACSRLQPLLLEESDLKAFKRWFQKEKPQVILSVDRFALRLCGAAGLSIPGDVGYASLDLDGVDPERKLGFSGIDQHPKKTGAAAVDLLVAAIQRNDTGIPSHPLRLQVEGEWVCGKTTPRRP